MENQVIIPILFFTTIYFVFGGAILALLFWKFKIENRLFKKIFCIIFSTAVVRGVIYILFFKTGLFVRLGVVVAVGPYGLWGLFGGLVIMELIIFLITIYLIRHIAKIQTNLATKISTIFVVSIYVATFALGNLMEEYYVDKHGCNPSYNEVWCEEEQKCIGSWKACGTEIKSPKRSTNLGG